jgi:hypothetical protein
MKAKWPFARKRCVESLVKVVQGQTIGSNQPPKL